MKATLTMLALAAGLLLGGCNTYTNLGFVSSRDMHPFVSSRYLPKTLMLLDVTTGDTVWKLDIPMDKMAVVQFKHEGRYLASLYPASPADEIRWEVFDDQGTRIGYLPNSQKLNGDPVLLKVTITPKPVAAPDSTEKPAPTTAPVDGKAAVPVPAPTPGPAPATVPEKPADPKVAPPAPAPAPAPAPPAPAPPEKKPLGANDAKP